MIIGGYWWIIIGAAIGGIANVVTKAVSGQLHSWKDGFVAFGIGAAAGVFGGAAGGWAFSIAGGAAGGVGGFLAGSFSGAVGVAASMPFQSVGNSMYFGDPYMSLKNYVIGIAIGAFTGGITNGTIAAFNNKNFWTGDKVLNECVLSYRNTPSNTTNPSTEFEFVENTSPANTKSNTSLNVQKPQKDLQGHHFASNKNKTFTPQFEEITKKYNLDLKGDWNIERLPHLGRHPDNYHKWVLNIMKDIDVIPNMSQQEFIRQFNIRIIQPVRANPDMLYSDYWNMLLKNQLKK